MAHESFEDLQAAEALNSNFICIKVDREERPDVDAVYMSVCQALTGSGGWPLTILMTPEQKPFWAGTYLPKRGQYGRIGLMELLGAVAQQWKSNRKRMLEAGEKITDFLKEQEQALPSPSEPSRELLRSAVSFFRDSYDSRWGGFGIAPKFPAAHNLLFLLRYSLLAGDPSGQEMAEHTLLQMYRGGIFDHIGGGFSRYSTDEKWLVPHFEKMLYDNALLALAYLEAYRLTRRPIYRTVTERTLGYVLRELTDEQGGFYCGQDADSDGVEGKYYVFTPQEIRQTLGNPDGDLFCHRFGITEQGNFEGKNIPSLLCDPDFEKDAPEVEALCRKVYAYRLARTRLKKDDKILTSWNALMIAALAAAGSLLDEPAFLLAAEKARRFIDEKMTDAHGRLYLRWREGEAAYPGHLDAYAFYAFALLALYRATFDVEAFRRALQIAGQMLELFSDPAGGFFLYASDSERLISRPKELYDGAMPSGNSVAALVLCRLAQLTGEPKWQEARDRQLRFLTGVLQRSPADHSAALLALSEVLYPSQELVCAAPGPETPPELKLFLREHVLPNLGVLFKTERTQAGLAEAAPFTASYPIPADRPLYYLCRDGACSAPVSSPDELSGLPL